MARALKRYSPGRLLIDTPEEKTMIRTKRIVVALSALALVASGCGPLKRWAYSGGNRDQWQKPDQVMAELELEPGDRVADLGAGGGYFTFRLADAVGDTGHVYAVWAVFTTATPGGKRRSHRNLAMQYACWCRSMNSENRHPFDLAAQSVEGIPLISIVVEDLSPFDSAQQHMLHRTRGIASRSPGHDSPLTSGPNRGLHAISWLELAQFALIAAPPDGKSTSQQRPGLRATLESRVTADRRCPPDSHHRPCACLLRRVQCSHVQRDERDSSSG